jgi:acetyl-CoA carboxylase biotin carboxyl carrier protein
VGACTHPAVGACAYRRIGACADPHSPAALSGARVIVRAVANVAAHIVGVVWKIECAVGDVVSEGDTLVVLESMKMEMPVEAEEAGTVTEIRCAEGQTVQEGDTLVVLG